jgi:hypothetical protein
MPKTIAVRAANSCLLEASKTAPERRQPVPRIAPPRIRLACSAEQYSDKQNNPQTQRAFLNYSLAESDFSTTIIIEIQMFYEHIP